jgi:hypothetical protein
MFVAVNLQTGGNGQRLILEVTHIGDLVKPGSSDAALEEQHVVGGGKRGASAP